jgi:hypothetical protein
MEIHRDDVVRARAGEEIGNQRAGLRNPLAVADLGLKGRRLRSRLSREAVDDGPAAGARLGAEVGALVRLVRVAALDAVELGRADEGIRRRAAAAALVDLHPAELVVQRAGAIGHARALGLAGVRRLRARVEGVCAGS